MSKELAIKIFYDALNCSYEEILELYPEFTTTYPLIVKYMCLYKLFDPEIYGSFLDKLKTSKGYDSTFEIQSEYVKHLLVKKGASKMEAKKQSNQELAEITQQTNNIKRKEKEIKRKIKEEKKNNIAELRRELIEFAETVTEN